MSLPFAVASQSARYRAHRVQLDSTIPIVLVLVCLFGAGHDIGYASSFEAIQQQGGEWVADLVREGNLLRRISLITLLCISLAMLFRRLPLHEIRRSARFAAPLWIFLGFAVLSTIWADEPSLALRRSIQLACLAGSAFSFSQLLGSRAVLHLAYVGSFIFAIVGVCSEIVLGTMNVSSDVYRFCGTMHPNHQAWQCALLLLSSSALTFINQGLKRLGCLASGLAGFALLLLTKSRTSLIALLLCLAVFALKALTRRQKLGVAAILLVVIAGGLGVAIVADSALNRIYASQLAGRGAESVYTLTGRLPLWTLALEYGAQRPLLGYGFGAFWTPWRIMDASEQLEWGVPESHCGYLEIFLGVGGIGLAIFVYLLLRSLIRYWAASGRGSDLFASFGLAMLVFYAMTMASEVIAFTVTLPTFIVFTLVCQRTLAPTRIQSGVEKSLP